MKKIKIDIIDIIIFLIVILIFTGALLAFSPALMTSDSPDQINQALEGKYKNAHPVFHTFIIGSLVKLTGSVSTIAIMQIFIFAIVWTSACKITRDKKWGINTVFQIIFTIIISLIPLNYMYSITIWKDIIYSYGIFASLVFIYIGIKKSYNYTYGEMVLLSLSLVFVFKTRHNGVPIVLIMFFILLVLNYIKNKKWKRTVIFAVVFILLTIISYIPECFLNIEDTTNTGSFFTSSAMYSMGAILNNDIELEEKEYEILDSILDVDTWRKEYLPYTGVPIHFNEGYNKEYLMEHEKEFLDIFKKYALQNKGTVLKHYIDINSIIWSVSERGYMHTFVTDNSFIREMTNGIYDTSPKSELLNNAYLGNIKNIQENSMLYTVLYRPSIYMYLSVILILYIMIKNKKFDYVLLVFPMLLNIGTYILLIGSQDLRYFYPNFLTFYFIILILVQMKINNHKAKKEEKEKEKGKEKIKNKKDKILVIVPAYNEEAAIKKVVENIYKQNPECDVIVINDGSKDHTLIEAKKTKAIVIDLPSNLGIGGAVQTGYLYAYKNNYDVAVQIDGDGQHDPKYIKQMIDIMIKEECDLVIGSRFVEKTTYEQTFFRMLGINITSLIIRLITGKKIYDTTSGYRAVNKEIIEEFAKKYPYDYPEPDTNMQMILKGKKVKEISVEMNRRTTGVSSISPLKSVSYMLKVSLSLLLTGLRKD